MAKNNLPSCFFFSAHYNWAYLICKDTNESQDESQGTVLTDSLRAMSQSEPSPKTHKTHPAPSTVTHPAVSYGTHPALRPTYNAKREICHRRYFSLFHKRFNNPASAGLFFKTPNFQMGDLSLFGRLCRFAFSRHGWPFARHNLWSLRSLCLSSDLLLFRRPRRFTFHGMVQSKTKAVLKAENHITIPHYRHIKMRDDSICRHPAPQKSYFKGID